MESGNTHHISSGKLCPGQLGPSPGSVRKDSTTFCYWDDHRITSATGTNHAEGVEEET